MSKTTQNKKSDKHPYTYACLNSCIEWKLTASFSKQNTSVGYVNNILFLDICSKESLFQKIGEKCLKSIT